MRTTMELKEYQTHMGHQIEVNLQRHGTFQEFNERILEGVQEFTKKVMEYEESQMLKLIPLEALDKLKSQIEVEIDRRRKEYEMVKK